jgi:hypothetical protein
MLSKKIQAVGLELFIAGFRYHIQDSKIKINDFHLFTINRGLQGLEWACNCMIKLFFFFCVLAKGNDY